MLQTWARLRDAGCAVELVGEVPRGAEVLVFHTKHRRLVARAWRRLRGTVLVSVRADGREAAIADVEIVQNGRFADGRHRFFIPHWPQPGLIPRDPSRGAEVRSVAFRGLSRHLHPELRSPAWASWLADRGIEWSSTEHDWNPATIDRLSLDWHDYRHVDVVLALRPPDPNGHRSKPASKLVNAWAAGCPAVLGEEYAYRELRRTALDYLEVADPAAARSCVQLLCSSPALFEDMVANGRSRARDFTVPVITAKWAELLYERLPLLANRGRTGRSQAWLRPAVWAAHAVGRLVCGRPTR